MATVTRKQSIIPAGSWPVRLTAELAAAYAEEPSVESFLERIGTDYPNPVIDEGVGLRRRRLWLRPELERANERLTGYAEGYEHGAFEAPPRKYTPRVFLVEMEVDDE